MPEIAEQLSFDDYLEATQFSSYKAIYRRGRDMFTAKIRVPKGTSDFILRLEIGKRAPSGYSVAYVGQL